MYQAHVWLQAAAAVPDAESAADAGDGTRHVDEAHTQAAVAATTGLRSAAELLAIAQQQQQQQQAAASLEGFWHYCAAAWSNNSSQVSGLQRQVFQVSSSSATYGITLVTGVILVSALHTASIASHGCQLDTEIIRCVP